MTENIRKLNDYEHIRLKTEVYLGSRTKHTQEVLIYDKNGLPIHKEMTWVPALYTAFREALDNAVDEVVGHGYGHQINVHYDEDKKTISIEDDGRGIPIEYSDEHRDYLASMVVTHARAGRNFDSRGSVAGTNGIGISASNFTSKWFELVVHRDHKKFVQRFEENTLPGSKALIIKKPKITDIPNGKTGTKVSFSPSEIVFNTLVLPEEFVRSRVFEVALANPLVRIFYNGQRVKASTQPEKTLFPNYDPIVIDIKGEGFTSKFILVPNFNSKGEIVHSTVNSVPAFNGGVHIDTFKRVFYGGLLAKLEREGKRRQAIPNRSDISDGMLIYNITHMKAPDFDSQSKTRLINEWVGDVIKGFFSDEKIFGVITKRHKPWIESIFEKAAARTNKRDLVETKKAARSAKKARVAGLMDACGRDRSKCILLLAEGLCLEENTNVKVLKDGDFVDLPLKEIEVGDVVITHKNRLKSVVDKWSKVEKGIKLSTSSGEIIGSKEHRMFVCNIEEKRFEFVELGNLDKTKHKLVKSKLTDIYSFDEISKIESIIDDTFDLKIAHGIGEFSDEILTTKEHKFAVFDFVDMSFKMKSAGELDIENDVLVLKKH